MINIAINRLCFLSFLRQSFQNRETIDLPKHVERINYFDIQCSLYVLTLHINTVNCI